MCLAMAAARRPLRTSYAIWAKNTRGSEKPRLKVVGLNDNMPIFSAYANDEGYDRVFAEQIIPSDRKATLCWRSAEAAIPPTCSKGVKAAREKGMFTIGLTGYAGGKLKGLVDLALVVPVNDMEQVEDAHMILDHLITGLLRGRRYDA